MYSKHGLFLEKLFALSSHGNFFWNFVLILYRYTSDQFVRCPPHPGDVSYLLGS